MDLNNQDNKPGLDPSTILLAGFAAAFGVGSYKAHNISSSKQVFKTGFAKTFDDTIHKFSKTYNEIFPSVGRHILSTRLFSSLPEIEILSGKDQIDSYLRQTIGKEFGDSIDPRSLTVGRLLDSIELDQSGRAISHKLKSGETVYKSKYGVDIKKAHLDSLQTLLESKSQLINRNTAIDPNLFIGIKGNGEGIYEKFGLHSVKRVLRNLQIPLADINPFDSFIREDGPIAQRVTREWMNSKGFADVPGAIIGNDLFYHLSDGSVRFVASGYETARRGSSAAIADLVGNKVLRQPKPFFSEMQKVRPNEPEKEVKGIIEQGHYDLPVMQKLFGGVLNSKLGRKIFGEQSFVYRESDEIGSKMITPLTAKADIFLDKILSKHAPGLNVFSRRYAMHGNIIDDFVEKGRKFRDELESSLETGSKELLDEVDYEHKSVFKSGKKAPQSGNLYGSLEPNRKQRLSNISQGIPGDSLAAPDYVPLETSPKAKINRFFAQGTNTTVSLFDQMTGIGIAPMGPAGHALALGGAATAAYFASDAFSLVDYISEKMNPFGDVGIKKSLLYLYSAARTAQQYILNYISPVFSPIDSIAPGLNDSMLGMAGKGILAFGLGKLAFRGKMKGIDISDLTEEAKNIAKADTSITANLTGVAAGLFFGTMEMAKSAGDRWDEYTGKKLVAVREGRFWGIGPQDWRGGDVKYYRKSLIASELTDEKYDVYGGHAGYLLGASSLTLPLKMIGGFTGIGDLSGISALDPYYVEKLNYHKYPYPLTGNMFENVPIVGDIMGATIGQVFKPTRVMHAEEIMRYYRDADTSNARLSSIANELGMKMVLSRPEVPRSKTLLDAIGSSADKAMDFLGLRGFLLSQAKLGITGDKSFTPEGMTWKDAGELNNISKNYNDMQLGGIFGQSELIRRILTNNRGMDQFNPMNPRSDKSYTFFAQSRVSTYDILSGMQYRPDSGATLDPLHTWRNHDQGDLMPSIPYINSKLYGNKTPMQLYKERVITGNNYYDWDHPYEMAFSPFFYSSQNADIGESILKGAFLGYFSTRNNVKLQGAIAGSAVFGASNIILEDMPEREKARRETEAYYDALKYKKIDLLKQTAANRGRNDIVDKLGRMQSETMLGIDYSLTGGEFLKQAYKVMPKSDQRFLYDFANAPKTHRQEILDNVPEYMSKILTHVWSEQRVTPAQSQARANAALSNIESQYGMPDDKWLGFNPGVNLDDIKLTSVYESGRNTHEYGFWGNDERDYIRNKQYLKKAAVLPDFGSYGLLTNKVKNSYGLSELEYDMSPAMIDRNRVEGSYEKDRTNSIMNHITRTGRY